MRESSKLLSCSQPISFPMENIGRISDLFSLNRTTSSEATSIETTTASSAALFTADAICPSLLFPPTCLIQPELIETARLSHRQDNQNAVVMTREEALVTLSEKTSYPILQENGQRRYGPPPDWKGPQPPRGCEVFIGKIPRDCFEDELVPIFEMVGRIYMFRLMMDFSGCNRGYGFCIYTNREDTRRAVAELDSYEIRRGKMLGVCFSVDNCRLFVGGIPKNKTKEEVMIEMLKVTEGVKDVIVYPSVADKTKNRGFAFVEYENHKAAAMARRKLIPGRIHLWGHQIAVDWAEPEREVDEDIMSKVRILYVRNLMLHTTEEALRDYCNRAVGSCDAVERVKKIRDYAFVHFRDRLQASLALRQLDGTLFEGSLIEVTWAKPVDKNEGIRVNRLVNNSLTTPVFNMSNFCLPPNNCDLVNSVTSKLEAREISRQYCHQVGSYSPEELMATPQVNVPIGLRQMNLFDSDHQLENQLQQTCLLTPVSLNSSALSAFYERIPLYQSKVTTLCEKPSSMMWSIPQGLVTPESAQLGLFPVATTCEAGRSSDTDTPLLSCICPSFGYGKPFKGATEQTDSMKNTLRSNDATKLLAEVCMKHGFELPKVMTRVREGNISQADKRYPTFDVQLYLPAVQRYFNSPNPLLSVEEATQSAALVTLQWLSTNLPLPRSQSDGSQKHYLIPELFAPKPRDNSLLPCQNYVTSQGLTNSKMHYTVNSACPDGKSIQSFGRQNIGIMEATLKHSNLYPVGNRLDQNMNEIPELSLSKLLKPIMADFTKSSTEIMLSNTVVDSPASNSDRRSTYFESFFNDDSAAARLKFNLIESDISRLKLENKFNNSAKSVSQQDSRANAPRNQGSLHCKLMYVNQEKEASSPQVQVQPVEHKANDLNSPTTCTEATLINEHFDTPVHGGLTHNGLHNFLTPLTHHHHLGVHSSNHISSPAGLEDKSVQHNEVQANYNALVYHTKGSETQRVNTLHPRFNSTTLTHYADGLT